MTQAAGDSGVGWHTAMAGVRAHGQPLVEDSAPLDSVEALGLEEAAINHARSRRRTTYVTGFVDLYPSRLLDAPARRAGR